MKKTHRRHFLQLSAAAAVAPVIWIPKSLRAAPITAKHLLLLHAKGGFRSHCTFNAVGAFRHNPFGAQPAHPNGGASSGGRDWALGAACGNERPSSRITGNHGHHLAVPEADIAAGVQKTYTLTGGGHTHTITLTAAHFTQLQSDQAVTVDSSNDGHAHTVTVGAVPSFARISNDVTVIGTVDHAPGGAHDPNHRTAIYRMATGLPDGANGLLSIVGRSHAMYQSGGFSMTAVPPVEINPSEFGLGVGSFATTRPLSLLSAYGGFDAGQDIGKGWKMQARAALDARFRDRRSRNYRPRLSEFLVSKQNAAAFADLLKDPKLDVIGSPDTVDAGFSNADLVGILGDYDLTALGDLMQAPSWGTDVALALRFFGFGSPMAVVTRDWYDMHDGEQMFYGPRTKDLVRQYAGLHYLLHNMPHPDGGTYWDHTVVATVSEFSRNNTDTNGFNSGAGSDHVGTESGPSRNQAIALMGGPIAASRGKLIGPTNDQINAVGTSFHTRRLLSTFLDLLGIDPATAVGWNEAPISELYA